MSTDLDREAFSGFVKALAFASRKHSQQRRKDKDASPYINHPIALVSILAVEAGIHDPDVLCAALLHDTIEDTETSVEELVETFGGHVASLVQEVTDDKGLPKAERKLRQIEHASHLSPKAGSPPSATGETSAMSAATSARSGAHRTPRSSSPRTTPASSAASHSRATLIPQASMSPISG